MVDVISNSTGLSNLTGSTANTGDKMSQDPFSSRVSTTSSTIYIATVWPLLFSALLFNYFLLNAMSKVKQSTLKAKLFIQTMGVTNVLVAFTGVLELDVYSKLFGAVSPKINNCFLAFFRLFYCLTIYAQCVCALGLVTDRLYVILSPLNYRTIGYNKAAKIGMVMCIIVVPLLLFSASIFTELDTGIIVPDNYFPFCFIFEKSQSTLPYHTGSVSLAFHCLCFIIYMSIMGIIRCYQKKAKHMRANEKQESKAVFGAYLMTNLSTLILYSPAPILMNLSMSLPPDVFIILMRISMPIYMVNCSLQPIILAFRVPAIKQNLPFDLNFCGKRKREDNPPTRATKLSAIA